MKPRILAVACAALLSTTALAQAEWPEDREITMIVAYAAGGGTDILARTIAPYLEKYLEGASIVVVNRPGPGGEYGFTETANADPDGYTIGFTNAPGFITLPYERETRYEFADFEPIANIVTDPASISVAADSEFESIDDVVAFAQENPGAATIGMQGYGSAMHLSLVRFLNSVEDLEVTMVPFPGTAPNRTAVMGGHITAGVFGIGEAATLATEEDTIRILGVMADERNSLYEQAPTFAEQGYDVSSGSDRGFAAPAGTPMEIVNAIAEAVEKTMEDPEFLADAEEQFLPLNYMGPEEYKAHLTELNEEIGALWESDPWR